MAGFSSVHNRITLQPNILFFPLSPQGPWWHSATGPAAPYLHFTFNFSATGAAFCAICYFCLRCEGNARLFAPLRNSPQCSCLTSGHLLSAISIRCMTPSPEEDACCYTFCGKTLLKSKLLLAVMKFVSIASHGIWEKKTHSVSMWVTQKVKSEKETGGNWYTCYYKTETSMRQTKWLKQAYIRCPGSCPGSWHETDYMALKIKKKNKAYFRYHIA